MESRRKRPQDHESGPAGGLFLYVHRDEHFLPHQRDRHAVGAGLIEGTTATTLSPKATATRAQTAALVQRLDVWVG
jgi:hypothetical protein